MIVFDIETKPLPLDEIKRILGPFEPSLKHPGEFDESAIKTGNLKDPLKISAKIEAAREEHASKVASFDRDLANAETNYWEKYLKDEAALKPATATVCAIGYEGEGKLITHDDTQFSEAELIREFWDVFRVFHRRAPQGNIVGFNCNGFDVPFLAKRSWILGIDVPFGVFTPSRYVGPVFIDLLDRWRCGDRREYIGLDSLCRAFGIPGKPDDCTGALFHQFLGDPATYEVAIDYLRNDLRMHAGLARAMQVL